MQSLGLDVNVVSEEGQRAEMRDEDDDLLRAAEELGIDLSGVRAGDGDGDGGEPADDEEAEAEVDAEADIDIEDDSPGDIDDEAELDVEDDMDIPDEPLVLDEDA
jgi:DNA-directed RNA polymerase subunit beta